MHELRKTVTIFFADVVESTVLGDRLDLEAVRDVMSRYFAEMAQIVESHGGTVEKFIGDEVMAVFGVPGFARGRRAPRGTRRGRDALAALRAECRARSELGDANRDPDRHQHGEVVAGDPSSGHGFVPGTRSTSRSESSRRRSREILAG